MFSRRLPPAGLVLCLLLGVPAACNPGPSATGSASASATSGTTTPETASGDAAGFLIIADAGPGIAQCDPGLQDCPEGEKCTPYVSEPGACCVDSTTCTPLTGTQGLGERCLREATSDDCEAGLFCMTSTSGGVGDGICIELCDLDDPHACGEDGACIGFNDGWLPLCERACDPLLQDCPGEDTGCYAALAYDRFICSQTSANGGDGDPCHTIQSCAPGLVCLLSQSLEGCASERCCTPVCDLTGDGSECVAAAETCVAPWPPGEVLALYEDVGLCVLPD